MKTQDDDRVREQVRTAYAKVARGADGSSVGCCGEGGRGSLAMGYSEADLVSVPEGSNLGLGCGNPQAIAALRPGETVLDLGSGAGFDCFLAARRVGRTGQVIGVDMTPEMIGKARDNARRISAGNVEFRLGEIEHLPVGDASVDVVISNCVINLSPDKGAVFREAKRVLKPGGRLAISDVVATRALPSELAGNLEALTGCVAGAASVEEVRSLLSQAGFEAIEVSPRPESAAVIVQCMPGAETFLASAVIQARKPEGPGSACCAPACCT